jgi:hypothetical protein
LDDAAVLDVDGDAAVEGEAPINKEEEVGG